MTKGRPRQFDADKALDAALLLFWRHGYEGTSLAMLSDAMGIKAPSLYSAFGNKEMLFRTALERYLQGPASYLLAALKERTARRVVRKLFEGAIDLAIRRRRPDGCMLVQGALATGPDAAPIRRELSKWRSAAEAAVRRRFQLAVASGDLPSSSDPARSARYVMTLIWGMSVQAAGGANRAQLEEVAALAIRFFPAKARTLTELMYRRVRDRFRDRTRSRPRYSGGGSKESAETVTHPVSQRKHFVLG